MNCPVCNCWMDEVNYRALNSEAQIWTCHNYDCIFHGVPRFATCTDPLLVKKKIEDKDK